jgi:Pectate lyase superfamily protein/Major tropism determinant N-terminal domain
MAIVQISRIQIRRGLQQDLPQLASAEMGWSLDTQKLYIGNGTVDEGAPVIGVTEILTERSDLLSLVNFYTFKNLASGVQVVTGTDSAHPIVRSLQDKLDDFCSVKDFGAKGDGVTDDTAAIQRALDRTYGGSQGVLPVFHHRTVYFPAGDYKITATLNIPPFTRIQGEGKRTTIIEGAQAGPLAQLVDGLGQVGTEFGNNSADASEYHMSDISFARTGATYNQSCLAVDGGVSMTFNRVMFRGALVNTTSDFGGSTSTSFPSFDVERTDANYGGEPAGVKMPNNSFYLAVKNVVFNQCDFVNITCGVEMNQDCHGITINDCYFDFLYHYIVAGNLSPDPIAFTPYGISITNNYFRYSAREGIYCYPFVTQVMSLGNSYFGYGQTDWPGATPVVNPYNEAQYPAIVFNADSNFSIGDSFTPGITGNAFATTTTTNAVTVSDTSRMFSGLAIKFAGNNFGGLQSGRQYFVNNILSGSTITISNVVSGANVALSTATGAMQFQLGGVASGVKYVEDNGYLSYQVMQDIGVVDGRKTVGRARTTTLANAASFTSAGLNYIPGNYTNLVMDYTVNHANAQRAGTLSVVRVGSTFNWDDEYTETGTAGVVLQANTTTGDIEYTSTSVGNVASITYNLTYFS